MTHPAAPSTKRRAHRRPRAAAPNAAKRSSSPRCDAGPQRRAPQRARACRPATRYAFRSVDRPEGRPRILKPARIIAKASTAQVPKGSDIEQPHLPRLRDLLKFYGIIPAEARVTETIRRLTIR